MKKVIDHKKIDMIDEEWEYYKKLINSFSSSSENSGSEYFRDTFDTDENGYIYIIRPPLGKPLPWAVILFLQNLMINQQERKRDEIFKNKIKEVDNLIMKLKEMK